MSSYFDEIRIEGEGEAFIKDLIDWEEKVIKEVNLVTGDREFPEELREKIQTLIATKRVRYLGGEINEEQKIFAETVGYSNLLQDLHSAFHVVAARRIKTRFGILSDSPSVNLIMREHHDHEALVGKDPTLDADIESFTKDAAKAYMEDPEAGLKTIKEIIAGWTDPNVVGYQVNGEQFCLDCAKDTPLNEGDEGPWAIKKGDPDWSYGSVPVCCKCNREINTLEEEE